MKTVRIPRFVWTAQALFVLAVTVATIVRYYWFLYDGFDLGIFSQVAWNTVHGHWFAYSFANYSYLVDHREWLFIPVMAVFGVFRHPLTLVFLQTLGLAAAATPLYLIAGRVFAQLPRPERLQRIVVIAYLLHPMITSTALFEFHMVPFSIVFVFWLWWWIDTDRLWLAGLMAAAVLFVREDTGLALVLAGPLIGWLYRQRGRRYILFGLALSVVSAVWSTAMIALGGWFAPDKHPKFFIFYYWLADTPTEAIYTTLQNPLYTLSGLFGWDHGYTLFFLFATFAFLPLVRLRYTLPAMIHGLLFFFIGFSILVPLVRYHYGNFLFPWLALASLYGYAALRQRWAAKRFELRRLLLHVSVVVVLTVQVVLFGPYISEIHYYRQMAQRDLTLYEHVLEQIQPTDKVIASERFYGRLALRADLYPSMHIFTGKRHFSDIDYELPDQVDWIVLESESIANYGINLPLNQRQEAASRLRSVIDNNELVALIVHPDLIVFGHGSVEQALPVTTAGVKQLAHSMQVDIHHDVTLFGWEYQPTQQSSGRLLVQLGRLDGHLTQDDDEHMELTWYDAAGNAVAQQLYPIGYGIDPTHNWLPGEQRTLYVPIERPAGAFSRVELTIGPLTMDKPPFFGEWSSAAQIDPDQRWTIPLPDVLE